MPTTNQLDINEEVIALDLKLQDLLPTPSDERPWRDYQVYFINITSNENIFKVYEKDLAEGTNRVQELIDFYKAIFNDQREFMSVFFQYRTNRAWKGDPEISTLPTDIDDLDFLNIAAKLEIAPKTGYLHVHAAVSYVIRPTYGLSYGFNAILMNDIAVKKFGHNFHILYAYKRADALAMEFYINKTTTPTAINPAL